MQTITIPSSEYQDIISRLDTISQKLSTVEKKPADPWLDNQELMQLLKVSRRTLQNYRDTNEISYSIIGNKLYYRLSDVQELLNRYYKKRLV